jgi:diguanylate cyclase (GGDEF)-like protein/PAS domain S-box-containing protein
MDSALELLRTQSADGSSVDPIATLICLKTLSAEISQAPDFSAALLKLLELVCQHTQWIFGEVWLPQGTQHIGHSGIWYSSAQPISAFGQASVTWSFGPNEGLPGRVWSTQQVEWLADVSHGSIEGFQRRELALQNDLGAGVGVPICLNGSVLMVLVFVVAEVQERDLEQIRLVEAIATHVGPILSLKQAESQLRTHQQQQQRLFNTLPGIIFTTAGPPDWRLRSLSEGCLALTGYTPAELIAPDSGVSYNDITHPDDLPQVLQTIQTVLTQGPIYEVEYRLLARQGEEKWVWEKGQAIFDAAGEVVGLEGFITEITTLKRTETALRQSETRYRLLAERSQDLISQHDLMGRFRYVSPACQQLLGYDPVELIGQSVHLLIHPNDRRRILQRYRHLIRHDSVHTWRLRVRHRNGTYRWLETISCTVEEPTGSGTHQVLAVSRDITDRVDTEQTIIDRERFLSLVLDNIPQHLFWKDRNGIYQGCNQAFARSIGLHNKIAIIGKTDYDIPIYSTEMARLFRHQDQSLMKLDRPQVNVLESYGDPDLWLSCSKFPIHDTHERVVGILGILEDVSDRIAFQKTLNRREQYLTALVELQRQFLDLDDTWDNDRYCTALQPLGEAIEANRVYIYEFAADAPHTIIQRAQWVSPGTPNTFGHESVASFDTHGPAAPWLALLRQGQCINQTLEHFPEQLKALLGRPPSNVKSILLLPLKIAGQFSGIIGFSNCQTARIWSASEVNLLRVAANAIAIAIERFQTEVSLRQAESKYRSIFENAVEGIYQATADGRYITVNPMLAKIYGYDSPQQLMATLTNIEQQLYVDVDRRRAFVQHMLTQGSLIGYESAVYQQDGSIIWISESARTLYNAAGEVIGFEGTVEDITLRKRTEMELHWRDRLLQGVSQASKHLLTNSHLEVSIATMLSILGTAADADRVYLYENHPHPTTDTPAMSLRYEWTKPGITPHLDHPAWQNQSYEACGLMRWYRAFQAGQPIHGKVSTLSDAEQQLLSRNTMGSVLMVPIFIDNDLWGYIGFDMCQAAHDWTPGEASILATIAASIGGALKRQHTEEQMRYQAFHDPLTGLPNRIAFNQHLPQAILTAHHANSQIAVMFLDLDRFKNINDTLGHAVGDKLLVQATQRLNCELRKHDMLSRWGGDEFTLILQNLDSRQEAEKIAQRLAANLRPPFIIENQELYVTSSIGIAMFPTDGDNVTTLLKNADTAMYAAKAEGRNKYCFYTSTLNSRACRQLALEKYLHQALQQQEFRLAFQPQINTRQGKIARVEALIRWHNPVLGDVPPNDFIPLAEEIGLIIPLGDWVLKQACYQLQTWHRQGFTGLGIAVNLSAHQLQHPSLVANLEHVLDAFDLSPQDLEIEITETAALSNIEASILTLNQLRQLGTRIVMDDFGTGYSSLSYLKRLPFHGLKIDRSFVQDIPTDTQDVAMLRAIIALGHELQLGVVAEGVETPEQMACLRELGCHDMQGYWFSHPLDAADMTDFLIQHWPNYNANSTE